MSTKEKLLELLEPNKGTYLSGEEIASRLGISRAAVWKAVKELQNGGYLIDAVRNKGYCLSSKTDILSAPGVSKYIDKAFSDLKIEVIPVAESTNLIVREKADSGVPEGYVVIANEQTKGRGRLGRSFYSPEGTGVYMSILLRPKNYSAKQAVRITTIAAVAVCDAIDEISGDKAQIKWVNDVFVRGKKVCGILTEASFGLENGMLEYAVLGVGINVYSPKEGLPDELKDIMGFVFEKSPDSNSDRDNKNRLAATFLNRFFSYYNRGDEAEYVKEYRARSLVIGKDVIVLSGNNSKKAFVVGVDEECHLIVRYEDGEEENLSSGEISIRL